METNGHNMIYSIEINSADIETADIINYFYCCNNFTLTVNAVNDAPVLLQPLVGLEIIEYSEAAAMVQSTVFSGLVHLASKLL